MCFSIFCCFSVPLHCLRLFTLSLQQMRRRCCGQFHQYFTNSFCANILAPKKYKPKPYLQKSWSKDFRMKKLLIKYWWNWHQPVFTFWICWDRKNVALSTLSTSPLFLENIFNIFVFLFLFLYHLPSSKYFLSFHLSRIYSKVMKKQKIVFLCCFQPSKGFAL